MKRGLIITVICLSLTGCITGSHVVTGTSRTQVKVESVKVFPAMPANAEVIGIVTANSTASFSWDTAKLQCLYQLRKGAGQIGANGIVVNSVNDSIWEGQQMSATAFFVP